MLELKEIKRLIDRHKTSPARTQARIARRYYNSEHDIKDYRLFYYDVDRMLQEDKHRSNIKISHPFFRELVEQCTSYLLSGGGDIVKSDNPDIDKELQTYFDDVFKSELASLVTSSQVDGFAYLYMYKGIDDKIRFKAVDGLGVIEVNSKLSQDGNEYIIYYYEDTIVDKKLNEVTIERVQVWDKQGTHFYTLAKGKLELDKDVPRNPRPHILYREADKLFYDVFDDIPFYRFDNNPKQESELKAVKDLIDDYDLHACSLSNDIQDMGTALYVVRGYQGNNMDELQKNLKTKKIVGVGEEGGIDVKTVNIPYEARKIKLELNEKNIYKFGFGFNSSQMGDGNITNVVIKSRYALLDLKCNRIEGNLRKLMKELITVVLDEINQNNETGYQVSDTYIELERNIITNELDNADIEVKLTDAQAKRVQMLLGLTHILGEDVVLAQIGDVLDIDVTDIDLDTLQGARLEVNRLSDLMVGMGQ